MARDPLIVLARLRALQRDEARRDMAAAQEALAGAEQGARAAGEAVTREAVCGPVADYAAWLPAAHRAEQRAGETLASAEAMAEGARLALLKARADAEAVDQLRSARRAAHRRARESQEQRRLEEAGRRVLAAPDSFTATRLAPADESVTH
jgi:hypothetical protein